MASRGTKRGATSFDAIDPGDSLVQGKRLVATTGPDACKVDTSHQRSMAKPPFDEQRLELAHRYVRALNNQFASWVQSQLQNHPDELWDGGLQDYLTHSSKFLEDFSDVVAYLKEKTTEETGTATPALSSSQNVVAGVKGTENRNLDVDVAAHGFPISFSAGVPYGNHASNLSKPRAAEDLDEENDLPKPSSPSVKRSEEKGIIVVYEVKCKVYVKPDKPEEKGWKDMGTGMLYIKCKEGVGKATKDSKPIIIARNEAGKILLNASIYPGIRTTIQKNTMTSIFHTLSGDAGKAETVVSRTFLLRTKTEEETKKLAAAIQEYAPATGN